MNDARIEAATLALLHSDSYDMPRFSSTDLQNALSSEHKGHGESILFTCKRCLCEQAQKEAHSILDAADAAAWRPIETAPRDGTRILIRKTTGHICVAFFDDGEWYGDDWYCLHHDEYITHWQPLPAPPDDDVKS